MTEVRYPANRTDSGPPRITKVVRPSCSEGARDPSPAMNGVGPIPTGGGTAVGAPLLSSGPGGLARLDEGARFALLALRRTLLLHRHLRGLLHVAFMWRLTGHRFSLPLVGWR